MPPPGEIWCVDFEFMAGLDSGERPRPLCMVALELRTGRELRLWRNELLKLSRPPFATGPDALFVAFFAAAELGCFLELGWSRPARILDLYVEFRAKTNIGGKRPSGFNSLLGALAHHGLATLDADHKTEMRDRIQAGGPFTAAERAAILDYCASDVAALARLLGAMGPALDWPQALLRGRYIAAVAHMERAGTPIDVPLWRALAADWERLKEHLIRNVDGHYGIYDGTTFKLDRFVAYLARERIPWPVYPDGPPILKGSVFRDQALSYPQLGPLHQLRQTTSQMRLTGLTVGRDGRNRCLLSPFASVSGRNQPSNSKFIFGPATWMRGLIRPGLGQAIAYLDWSAQEIAIAAALSGDEAMIAGYRSGDPHIAFAKLAGLAPDDATADTHPQVRAVCKTTNLGTNYGMSKYGLGLRLGLSTAEARALLQLHRSVYRRFWRWAEGRIDDAMLTGVAYSEFGWPMHVTAATKPRSLLNFPMQSNGAECMRLAAIAATEAGLEISCPVHDGFVLCAPAERIEADVAAMCEIMRKAGLAITRGLEVRVDAKIVRYPDRYRDPRGVDMWGRITRLRDGLGRVAA
jgi:DNA polymerase I